MTSAASPVQGTAAEPILPAARSGRASLARLLAQLREANRKGDIAARVMLETRIEREMRS